MNDIIGTVFDIQKWSLHDGPGIRTVVFLKGCTFQCPWCHNPESQHSYPELAFFENKCIKCMYCINDCPYDAIEKSESSIKIERTICQEKCYGKKDSFPCVKRCYSDALTIMGKKYTVEQVMDEVRSDQMLYKKSGGGVTLSGGEVLCQLDFAREILKSCKDEYIHTCIETNGHIDFEKALSLFELCDLVFLDLKQIDNSKHKEIMGQGSDRTLDTAVQLNKLVEKTGLSLIIRIPYIPTYNDNAESIELMADFIKENLNNIEYVELMPYHRMGRAKYSSLGYSNTTYDLREPEMDEMEKVKEQMLQLGVNKSIKIYGE